MQITAEKLRKIIENKLQKISCLQKFYIGKTNDLGNTRARHEREGYTSTTPIAKGKYDIVSKTEETLIQYFQEISIMKGKNGNISPYSVGNDTADTIYVSIMISPQNDNELDDDDINWPEIYQLI